MKVRTVAFCGILYFAVLNIASAVIPGPGYEYGYDASSGFLPNDSAMSQPSWNYFFGPPEYASSATLTGGSLQIVAPQELYLIYRMGSGTPGTDGQSWNPHLSLGSTVQFSAQVLSGNNVQAITLYTPTNQFILSFGVSEISTFIFAEGSTATYANTGGFHTYQFNLKTDNTADVYVDGVFGFNTVGSGSGLVSRLEFGNGYAQLGGGTVNYEYLQWTNAGVLPVPEPATVAMVIGAVGVLALRRFTRTRRQKCAANPGVEVPEPWDEGARGKPPVYEE